MCIIKGLHRPLALIGNRFIFIHIPRTGGTSLERVLLSLELCEDWELMNKKQIVEQLIGPSKHYKASHLRDIVGQDRWVTATTVSIVRNPYDKVISHFYQPYYRAINALAGNSLESFLRAYRPAPHEEGYTCADYLDLDIDNIIRYENYTEELFDLLSPFGVKREQLLARIGAVRKANGYREFYSKCTRKIVEDLYAEDLGRFNYSF